MGLPKTTRRSSSAGDTQHLSLMIEAGIRKDPAFQFLLPHVVCRQAGLSAHRRNAMLSLFLVCEIIFAAIAAPLVVSLNHENAKRMVRCFEFSGMGSVVMLALLVGEINASIFRFGG